MKGERDNLKRSGNINNCMQMKGPCNGRPLNNAGHVDAVLAETCYLGVAILSSIRPALHGSCLPYEREETRYKKHNVKRGNVKHSNVKRDDGRDDKPPTFAMWEKTGWPSL
ncbi:hypothetical protein VaNZ11_007043 [Volvox africanus]|uniref:Uncharacterized protein n=1 Tax=Volvox africanus TaxID=51714 RepID=A0ABQ5S335_9CHLO|nr:hypothetical protein VaNZ11_007043 [Volvox africanus]